MMSRQARRSGLVMGFDSPHDRREPCLPYIQTGPLTRPSPTSQARTTPRPCHATILRNNALINIHTIEAARLQGVSRYLYSSSACIYPEHLQTEADVAPLKEEDAYPANPQDAYGWEKLVSERLCEYYADELGMQTRIVRFHNIYGPYGTFNGGREKAPAALCRKVAQARPGEAIEVWGDGEQTRSFCYVDDCVLLRGRLRRRHLPAHALRLS
jgi:GDP-D-mannose 3',5'-epimerase